MRFQGYECSQFLAPIPLPWARVGVGRVRAQTPSIAAEQAHMPSPRRPRQDAAEPEWVEKTGRFGNRVKEIVYAWASTPEANFPSGAFSSTIIQSIQEFARRFVTQSSLLQRKR